MKNNRKLTITAMISAWVTLAAFGIVRETRLVQASAATAQPLMPVDPTPTPCPPGEARECYSVLPSDTDEPGDDCPDDPAEEALGIGCEDRWPQPNGVDNYANNNAHYLYLPPLRTETGKLLVIFGGGKGNAKGIAGDIGPFAAQRGYNVIALAYPSAPANPCANINDAERAANCFGNAFHEVVTGEERADPVEDDKTNVSLHPQDAIDNRLLKVLQWADDNYPDDGWRKYLINGTTVDWTKVHIGGHSNGSSHSSYMGSIARFQEIGRVSLFAGPDDGFGETEDTWIPATYIQDTGGATANRYYGLTHRLNKAATLKQGTVVNPVPIFMIYKNWETFGMAGQNGEWRRRFDPEPGESPYFGDAHMLVSVDPERDPADHIGRGTTKWEAHNSVVSNTYCTNEGPGLDTNGVDYGCDAFNEEPGQEIGYEPAWRCILGTGDSYASTPPIAGAGPDQTVECQGGGGANVVLDGSGTIDYDCELLRYAWAGPFGTASGRDPTAFFLLGTSNASLVVSDDWWQSLLPDTMQATVVDTTPPSLIVTLSPTVLWPANHKMVRINATVNYSDSCGGAPPQVVLTSITSSQPDNGPGSGNTVNDIQDAQIDTFDQSFLLRAERAGGDPAGRTYTVTYMVTDASGNHTQVSKTVHVPH